MVGIFSLQLFSNLYNDFFDVQDGTDGLNDEYFNVGMNDPILEGAQLSGGSRAIELGLTTLKKTKYLANIMLICSLVSATVILLLSYLNTNSYQNAIYVSIIAVI